MTRAVPKGVLTIDADEVPSCAFRCSRCGFLMTAQSEQALRAAVQDHAAYARWLETAPVAPTETRSYSEAPR